MKIFKISLGLGSALFLYWSGISFAAEPTFLSCQSESSRFCNDEHGLADRFSCLLGHHQELSADCKSDLERFIQMRKQAASRSGGALSGFGGPGGMGPSVPLLIYEGRLGRGSSPGELENRVSLSAPIYKTRDEVVSLSAAVGDFHFGSPVVLTNGRALRDDWMRVEVGGQYFEPLSEKRFWSLKGSLGYAGDRFLNSASDLTFSLNANYGFPGVEPGYWILSLFMTNNGSFLNYVPVPGFAYSYRTGNFTGLFGFPILSIQWTPWVPWAWSLSLFGPNLQSELSYGAVDQIQIFSGLHLNRQKYLPSERSDPKDRLTLQESKVALGVRSPMSEAVSLELQAGRVLSRSVYIGQGWNDRSQGLSDLLPEWFGSVGVRLRL